MNSILSIPERVAQLKKDYEERRKVDLDLPIYTTHIRAGFALLYSEWSEKERLEESK